MQRIVLLGGLLTALALVAVMGTVTYMLFNVDDLIRDAVTNEGRAAYGTEFGVTRVDVSLKTGEGQLTGVTIVNPAGFSKRAAVYLPSVKLTVDTKRPTAAAIALGKLHVFKPAVLLEVNGGTANLSLIRAAAAANIGTGKSGNTQRLIIDELLITDGELTVVGDFAPGKELTAKMPDMRVENIGKDSGGATPDAIAQIVADTLIRAAERATRRIDLKAAGASADIDFKKLLEN